MCIRDRSGNRCDLRFKWMASDKTAQICKKEKRKDVRSTDMKSPSSPDNYRPENPDHQQGSEIISPLNTQARHRLGCEEEQDRKPKVGRIPDVSPFHPQHILRHDRNRAAQRIRPESGRTNEYSYANAGNVCTRKIQPFPIKDSTENQLTSQRSTNCQSCLPVALEYSVREMAHQKDEGDKQRSDVAIIKAETGLPRRF